MQLTLRKTGLGGTWTREPLTRAESLKAPSSPPFPSAPSCVDAQLAILISSVCSNTTACSCFSALGAGTAGLCAVIFSACCKGWSASAARSDCNASCCEFVAAISRKRREMVGDKMSFVMALSKVCL